MTSQFIRAQRGNRKYLGKISLKEFELKLKRAKVKVLKLSEKQLDNIIELEWKGKWLKAFDNSNWYVGEVVPSEVGVWRIAGGLPHKWTNGSLKETAEKVKYALENNPKLLKMRAKHSIQNILDTNVNVIQKEKYLLPIIFQGGTGLKGRKRLRRKMKGDISDGCMRSIALTVAGAKNIKVYIGYPKN